MKKIMIGIALGGIIFGSIVYAVNTYDATTILYNTSDGNTLNVQEALNDLYKNKNNGEVTTEQVKTVMNSVYNGEVKKYTISGKEISRVIFGNGDTSDSFSFDSGKINIYETPDGEIAVLNTIVINVYNSGSCTSYSYEHHQEGSSFAITMENGTKIRSGSTINETISLFNETIGESENLTITASGWTKAQGGTGEYSNAYSYSGIKNITLTYILIK